MPVTQGLPIEGNLSPNTHAPSGRSRPRDDCSLRRAHWMALAQRGDTGAYRTLLDDLGPVVVRFLSRRVRDREDLADAYQDTFLALHRARHTYQPQRPLEPWLFAIARNVAADYGRRRQRRARYEVLTDTAPEPAVEPECELGTRLDTAIRALPNRQREALQLLKFQGLSIAEAAARIGTTPAAIKIRAHRAYVALKAAFRK